MGLDDVVRGQDDAAHHDHGPLARSSAEPRPHGPRPAGWRAPRSPDRRRCASHPPPPPAWASRPAGRTRTAVSSIDVRALDHDGAADVGSRERVAQDARDVEDLVEAAGGTPGPGPSRPASTCAMASRPGVAGQDRRTVERRRRGTRGRVQSMLMVPPVKTTTTAGGRSWVLPGHVGCRGWSGCRHDRARWALDRACSRWVTGRRRWSTSAQLTGAGERRRTGWPRSPGRRAGTSRRDGRWRPSAGEKKHEASAVRAHDRRRKDDHAGRAR